MVISPSKCLSGDPVARFCGKTQQNEADIETWFAKNLILPSSQIWNDSPFDISTARIKCI